jgi:hypothetical protein
MQNDKFGRLLKGAINSIATNEAKTAPIIEDELGQQIGVSAASIQRYKAGHLPPEPGTIQVLAESAVKRGYLNRDWLQNFLHAARYPAPEKLLGQLCPDAPLRPQPLRVYHNLPAPTYSQFVMREQAYADVVDGLGQRSAAVIITSLGGMGKTSLAREVAARCLQGDEATPKFEAVVWVSDKDRPGTTTINTMLDEIARTLDYPGFTQFEPEEKRREIEYLLRRLRVLLVADNFETIQDRALLHWLLRLPEPSKALITTREYRPEFRRGGWPVELRGMSEQEAQALIFQRLRRLKIDKLVSDPAQLVPLISATGGNAKALELALGCLKYGRQPLQKVVANIHAARCELFDDLFARSWELLDEAARRVLLAMLLFPAGASREGLEATAGIDMSAFNHALERITDLTLLDIEQIDLDSPSRYALHPLVAAFARARLAEQSDLEQELRLRWVRWYITLASMVGYCWNDLERLQLLDNELDTLQSVIEWTLHNKWYEETLQLVKGAGYYSYIRGFWEKKPPLNLLGAEAARHLGLPVDEVEALAYHVQLLSKQGNVKEAEKYLPRLRELKQSAALPPDVYFMYQHSFGLYWMACNKLDTARLAWEASLQLEERLSPQLYIANRQWLATCLYRQGQLEAAQALFQEVLADACRFGYQQGIVATRVYLASLTLDRAQIETAAILLGEASAEVGQNQYRDHQAQLYSLYARLYILRGEFSAARASLTLAIDLFERLGMRGEMAEARQKLDELETPILK